MKSLKITSGTKNLKNILLIFLNHRELFCSLFRLDLIFFFAKNKKKEKQTFNSNMIKSA